MFRRTRILALAAAALGLLLVGSDAMARGRWRGGWGSAWGGGYGGYRSGYYGGYAGPRYGSYFGSPYYGSSYYSSNPVVYSSGGYAGDSMVYGNVSSGGYDDCSCDCGTGSSSPAMVYQDQDQYGNQIVNSDSQQYDNRVFDDNQNQIAQNQNAQNQNAQTQGLNENANRGNVTQSPQLADQNGAPQPPQVANRNRPPQSPQAADNAPSIRITAAKPPVPDTANSGEKIKLKLGSTAEGTVDYQLNGTKYTMNPGYSQTFVNDREWNIKFDDGTGNMQSQTLKSGNFEFVKNSDGNWELKSF